MAKALTDSLMRLKTDIFDFAKQEIRHGGDLYSLEIFPFDIWEKMGNKKLLGLNLPVSYGGMGKNNLALTVAGEALAHGGRNLGLTLSWLLHLVIGRFLIFEFGTEQQKKTYLPKISAGKITASFAVSEPETGAHPKYIKTSAKKKKDDYILTGEKVYLTNGPIADIFIVIATTGNSSGKKEFSAFMVQKDFSGLTVSKPMELDILRPSPHGSIELENCIVPHSSILGEKNTAYEKMVKSFREYEDVLNMGPLAGCMALQVEILKELMANQKIAPFGGLLSEFGNIISLLSSLKIIAYEAAGILDDKITGDQLTRLILAYKSILEKFQSDLNLFITKAGIGLNNEFQRVTADIVFAAGIGKNITKIKQEKIGKAFLYSS